MADAVAMSRAQYARWSAQRVREDPEAWAAYSVGLLDVPEDVEAHLAAAPILSRDFIPADSVYLVNGHDA